MYIPHDSDKIYDRVKKSKVIVKWIRFWTKEVNDSEELWISMPD